MEGCRMKRAFMLLAVMALCIPAMAQKISLSTNLLSYANLGTMNAEVSFAIARRWTIAGSAKYNPFTFGKDEKEFRVRQRAVFTGVEFWPWHVYSGWWMQVMAGCQEYNYGGFGSRSTVEGYRLGMVLAAGYSYMISSHLNVEFGLGGWGGLDRFTRYSCQVCGLTEDSGKKFFLLPSDAILSFCYVF